MHAKRVKEVTGVQITLSEDEALAVWGFLDDKRWSKSGMDISKKWNTSLEDLWSTLQEYLDDDYVD